MSKVTFPTTPAVLALRAQDAEFTLHTCPLTRKEAEQDYRRKNRVLTSMPSSKLIRMLKLVKVSVAI